MFSCYLSKNKSENLPNLDNPIPFKKVHGYYLYAPDYIY